MWPVALSGRLPVEALVSHYLTNKLIGRESIPNQKISFQPTRCLASSYPVLATVSDCYPRDEGRLLTCYSPVRHSCTPERALPFDLHVLSTPPAFVLSQDQTLHRKNKKSDTPTNTGAPKNNSTENPITNKPPQHTQPNAHTAEENQSKEKTRNKPKKQSLVHPQKNGIDLKHAVEFSRFGSHQSSNPVNLTAFPPNVKFCVPALSCTFSGFTAPSGSFSTVLPGSLFRKPGFPDCSTGGVTEHVTLSGIHLIAHSPRGSSTGGVPWSAASQRFPGRVRTLHAPQTARNSPLTRHQTRGCITEDHDIS